MVGGIQLMLQGEWTAALCQMPCDNSSTILGVAHVAHSVLSTPSACNPVSLGRGMDGGSSAGLDRISIVITIARTKADSVTRRNVL